MSEIEYSETYMDADCEIHNLRWYSSEQGIECPACVLENKLAALEAVRDAALNDEAVLAAIRQAVTLRIIPEYTVGVVEYLKTIADMRSIIQAALESVK